MVCDRRIPRKLKEDIQEDHPTGSFIWQRMLASTFWAHSGALRHGIEDADVNVRRKIFDKILRTIWR